MEKKWKIIIWIVVILILGFLLLLIRNEESPYPLIGGCGGVHPYYHQECCDRWALENDIVHVQCVGEWEVVEGECGWKCG